MGSWSTLCTTFFAKRLIGLIDKRINFFQTDRVALNVYCLHASLSSTNCNTDRKFCDLVFRKLDQSINRDRSVVYPLSRKEFFSQSWQTSARLLVLIEDKNACTDDQKLFNSELDLVAKFIADGGRVVVLLDPPSTSLSANRIDLETSLFTLVTTESEIAPLDANHCDASWQWSVQSPVKRFEQDSSGDIVPARALIGSVPNGSSPSVRFVAILAECVNRNWHLLLEALRLLGISCHNPDDTGVQTSSTDHVMLHYLIGPEGREADSNGEISPNAIQSKLAIEDVKSGTQYDLRTVRLSDPSIPAEFPWTVYTSTLQTRVLGRTLLWAESLPSSYTLGERLLAKLPADSGLMIVSNRQTEGKGRGSNRWISLVGQAAFTFHMTLRKPMGFQQHESGPPFPFMNLVTCVQHLVALAIVLAGRRILAGRLGLVTNGGKEPDPESLANLKLPGPVLRVKWPNDVYVVDDEILSSETEQDTSSLGLLGKLAGLLTKCSLTDTRQVDFVAGVGVNVQNVAPSICLQQVLDRIQPSASPITPAEMMAQVLNQMERMIDCVLGPQATHGLDWLMDLYMRCWIHGNKRILVQTPPIAQGGVPRACIIIGLDAFGYLRVRDVQNGAEYTLHPDGNSMDMMRGLICPK